MPEHSLEPWISGFWKMVKEGRKEFYVFTREEDSDDIHDFPEVYSGVEPGTKVHCSKMHKAPGKVVIGLDYDYSNTTMTFEDGDMRRAVACVNFCQGVDTKDLNGNLGTFVEAKWDARLAIRTPAMDEVIAVLKGSKTIIAAQIDVGGTQKSTRHSIHKIEE